VKLSKKIHDMPVGSTWGQWTVLSYDGERGEGKNTYWLCRCSCGTEKAVCGTLLRRGTSTKCHRCSGKINGRRGLYGQKSSHLYIAKIGEYYKIGVSDNPKRRLRDMQTHCPYDITLTQVYYGAGHEEEMWHEENKDSHHRGEWFRGEPKVPKESVVLKKEIK
jgi:hypothetical protein